MTGLRIVAPKLWQCRTVVERKNGKWLLDAAEYANSRTLDDYGNIITRSAERLLEDVKAALYQ